MSYPLISTPLFHFLRLTGARQLIDSLLQSEPQPFFDRQAHGGLFVSRAF